MSKPEMPQPPKPRTARWLWLATGGAALLLVIGIVTDEMGRSAAPGEFTVPTAQPAASAPTPDEASPEEEALFGPRVELPGGLLVKQIGKVAQWGGPADQDPSTWAVRLVVDRIELDPQCDEYTPAPDRGHRLVLAIRVETSEFYDPMRDGVPQYYEWSTVGPDGVSEGSSSSSHTCRDATAFPHELRPAAKYRGEVTVETANPVGQLVFADAFVYDYPAQS